MDDYDFQVQQEELLRRQKLVDALQQGQSPQGRQSGTAAFGSAVADLIGKFRAPGMREQLNTDQTAFRQRYNSALAGETNQYLDRMNGKPPVTPVDGFGPDTPAVAPNPREAVIRAMTSQLPEMQAMGKAGMASAMRPPEIKQHVIDGQLVEGTPGGQQRVAFGTPKAVDNFGPMETRPGPDGRPMMGQVNLRTNEFVPKGSSGQTINIGDKGNAELLKEVVPVVKGAREAVLQSQQGLDASQRVMQALNDPSVQTGFGASAITGLASLGAKLGFNGAEGVAKTQALASDLARNTLAAGQTMKGSFSDKDIQFLTDVTLGKVDFSKEALQDIAALAYQANHNGMLNAMDQYKSASQFKGMEGVAGLYPLPPVRWDATISDSPAFQKDESGRLRYLSSFSQAAKPAAQGSSQGRRRMSVQEFLSGGKE